MELAFLDYLPGISNSVLSLRDDFQYYQEKAARKRAAVMQHVIENYTVEQYLEAFNKAKEARKLAEQI